MARVRAREVTLAACLLAVVPALGAAPAGGAPRFRPDDPLRVDPDRLPGPLPAEQKVSDLYDIARMTWFPPVKPPKASAAAAVSRAVNATSLGEVADSSWFTNRIGAGRLTRDEIARGPNRGSGPAPGPWTVVGAKSQGVTPGFRIRDAAGTTYLLKFDPPSNPEMATAADAIGTRIFHALGYNVPENYLVALDPDRLVVDGTATIADRVGRQEPLTRKRVDGLLARVARRPDGSIRAVASRILPGIPIGPFQFFGTRSDDGNDIHPHQDRRELRGYYVFCSWLNHDDSRSINTLDTYQGEPGRGHVVHHLIDFGSILGSASVKANERYGGNEYFWEPGRTLKSIATLGLWLRAWVDVPYPDFPSLGLLEAEAYVPDAWRPEYPNPAFERMDAEDAYWAARLVMAFQDEDLGAIVRAGELSDPRAEAYLIECLIKRRDKVGRRWLRPFLALERFTVEGGRLRFVDLGERYGLEPAGAPLVVRHESFDNETGERRALGFPPLEIRGHELVLPERVTAAAEGSYFAVRLARGARSLDVFLARREAGLVVVGLEHHPEAWKGR